jgi:hypothetical protein
MTTEQLRKYKGCEHFSDVEAQEIVESLRIFAKTIIEVWHDNCIDNQQIINDNKIKNDNSIIINEINKAA